MEIDNNELFRQVTIRLTGELDVGAAIHRTILYLKKVVPLDQILLVAMDDIQLESRMLVRVSSLGVVGSPGELLFKDDSDFAMRSRAAMDHMPDIFVHSIEELPENVNIPIEERQRRKSQLGIRMDQGMLILGVKELNAGILFVMDGDQLLANGFIPIFEMLKEPFVIALSNAVRYYELERIRDKLAEDNRALREEVLAPISGDVIGAHRGLKTVMSHLEKVAPTGSPVMLRGETGTGKEVIAHAIHRASTRSNGPMISINCGAISETLLDSELFGHEKGAFTGAVATKRGRFERAEGGTLFLDEVGELPLSAQVKLLRVLQSQEFERVGGTRTIRADVRIVAATHRDLESMVAKGQFREDLWFRLNVFPIFIPPLRERREDIPLLAYHFLEAKCREMNVYLRPSLVPEQVDILTEYDWPGNVRELENAIERALIISRGEPLVFPYLESYKGTHTPNPQGKEETSINVSFPTYREATAAYMVKAMTKAGGKISGPGGAAELSGLNPSTFRSKLKKLALK